MARMQLGSSVTLKFGSKAMTIMRIDPMEEFGGMAQCAWQEDLGVIAGYFPLISLTLTDEKSKLEHQQ